MSFLQRKLNEQNQNQIANNRAADRADQVEPAQQSAPPPAPTPAPAQQASGSAPSDRAAAPQQIRTSGKISYLRKTLRSKLLKTPDEADTWTRDDAEKGALLTDRLKAVLDKIGQEKPEFRVNKQEFEVLREALLDDLL